MRNARVIGWCAVAWVTAAATSCGGKKPLPVIDPLSNVSGHWQLDEQQSDKSADKIAATMSGGDRGGDGTGGGGGGRRHGGWSEGARGSGRQGQRRRAPDRRAGDRAPAATGGPSAP